MMQNQKTERTEPGRAVLGVLAHVDAGKTTLAEGMLYLSGSIRTLGRVDHGNAFLDTFAMEKHRGITIFSKQAELVLRDGEKSLALTLLDTPGHVDFSAEMERTLQVLDAAVLVISGTDGVQAHVLTLWKLLKRYRVPVLLFVNKMDLPGTEQNRLLKELKERLSENCVAYDSDDFTEQAALCEEASMEHFLEWGTLPAEEICRLVTERKLFPCFFGSALRLTGITELMQGILLCLGRKQYPEEFSARVFKITREAGTRLTFLKLLGGRLRVRDVLGEEKVSQIRIYSGAKYRTVEEAVAGQICAVTGPELTRTGQGLGAAAAARDPLLSPVLTYRIGLPAGVDVHTAFSRLVLLEEEEPQLHLVWEKQTGTILAQVMGAVQLEILQELIGERFGWEVTFGTGSIVYKETLCEPVEGVGHFEPLRHYAEVHLRMEPGARGSGICLASEVSEDELDRNWQRLVLTHLAEREHRGVLIGAPLTDVKLTLVAGRAHKKHTEGGDFREATYRAVRQGLRMGKCMLLEPYYEFRLELPEHCLGRAMHDLERMHGSCSTPKQQGEMVILTGTAPVAELQEYPLKVAAYTKGRGRLFCSLFGYERCHREAEVITEAGYDPEADSEQPTGSVFCTHGAGVLVPWNEVPLWQHLESRFSRPETEQEERSGEEPEKRTERTAAVTKGTVGGYTAEDRELMEIFNRTYGGAAGKNVYAPTATLPRPAAAENRGKLRPQEPQEEYLLVDGYNMIFSWERFSELAEANLAAARQKLMDLLCNYQGFRGCRVILVFDAYRVAGFPGELQRYHNIDVVYTKEAETADRYIEKTVHEIGKKYRVTVATSDATEQVIIFAAGASRMSASELWEELQRANREIRGLLEQTKTAGGKQLLQSLPAETASLLQELRLGTRSLD